MRMKSLDLLRAVAVILVIFCHYPLLPIMTAGKFGVDLFFVLSGFLVSGLLFADIKAAGSPAIGRFLIRRGMKIYPAFYFFLLVTVLVSTSARHDHRLLSELLFVQNYSNRLWEHTWSLAVEEHFYIALPFLLLLLSRLRRLHWIPAISASLIVLCLGLRVAVAVQGTSYDRILAPTHLRIDALFAGVALGYWFHFQRERFSRLSKCWLPIPAVLLLLPAMLVDSSGVPMRAAWQFTLNIGGFGLLLAWAVTRDLRFSLLEQIGRYSYSIYLWHYMIAFIFRLVPMTSRPMNAISFGAYVLVALAVGVTMGVLIEMPILALRDRLFSPAKASPAKAPTPMLTEFA